MIRIIAALLILCHQVLTYKLSYSELEYLGGSCYPSDSCVPHREDHEDHLFTQYTCECGIHCIRRGTCCIDSPYAGNISLDDYLMNFHTGRGETCQRPLGFADDVDLISRCPPEMSGDQATEECERFIEYGDPLSMTPVTSLETNSTYKNYFCAWCNNDARNIALWNIHLEFPPKENFSQISNVTDEYFPDNLLYSNEQKMWGIVTGNLFSSVKMSITVPPNLQKIVKRCYQYMVTQCDPDSDDELKYKCSHYYAPIEMNNKWGFNMVYRNIHCAMCSNQVTASECITCHPANECTLVAHKAPTITRGTMYFGKAVVPDVQFRPGRYYIQRQHLKDDALLHMDPQSSIAIEFYKWANI